MVATKRKHTVTLDLRYRQKKVEPNRDRLEPSWGKTVVKPSNLICRWIGEIVHYTPALKLDFKIKWFKCMALRDRVSNSSGWIVCLIVCFYNVFCFIAVVVVFSWYKSLFYIVSRDKIFLNMVYFLNHYKIMIWKIIASNRVMKKL